jgi:hypothetical protein
VVWEGRCGEVPPYPDQSILLPAGNRIGSTVRYLGIEIDDAIESRRRLTSEVPGQSCRALPAIRRNGPIPDSCTRDADFIPPAQNRTGSFAA